MKKLKLLSLLTLFTVFIISCATKPVANPNLQREWMLVSFKDFSKEELVKANAKIDLKPTDNPKIFKGSAKMGCNSIFFSAELKGKDKIMFSDPGSTMMACFNMKLETEFLKTLPGTKNFSIDGHFLTITDENGQVMKFVAADWD